MAFTSCTVTVNNIASLSDLPNTTDGLTSAQLKQKFDQTGTDLKTYLNSTLLSELASTTTSSSASENIGGRLISAKSVIAGISAGSLYSQLNSLHTQLNSFVAGTGFIPTTGGTFTGSVEFPLGTSSVVSINGGDADSGIYFPAASTQALVNNGTESLRTTSTGKVLFGGTTAFQTKFGATTVSPDVQIQKLDDKGSLLISRFSVDTESPRLFFAKSRSATEGGQGSVLSGDNSGDISFGSSDGTSIIEAARIRVEIDGTPGTNDMPGRLSFMTTPDSASVPTEKMRVSQDGTIRFNSYTTAGFLKNDTSGNISTNTSETGTGNLVLATSPSISNPTLTGQVSLDTAGTASAPALTFSTDLDTGVFRAAANQLAFSTAATEALRINTVQRVLINNTTQFTTYRGATSAIPQFQVAGTSKDTSSILSSIFSADAIGSRIFFAKSRNATIGSFTIVNNGDSLGEISFGGSHDSQIYEAARIVSEADGVPSDGTSMPGRISFSTTASGATTVTERMRVDSAGAVSITAATTASAANVFIVGTTSGTVRGELQRSTSSRRYKTNINDYDKGIEKIKLLRPVYYNGINDGDTQFAGLIAEEVHDAGLQEFVQYNENNEPESLAYTHMNALLIKTIQEQQQLIEQLQSRIELLESKVN